VHWQTTVLLENLQIICQQLNLKKKTQTLRNNFFEEANATNILIFFSLLIEF
jgi:5-methylcytosine-specific restriction endonuclease McrA